MTLLSGCAATGDRPKPPAAAQANPPSPVVQAGYQTLNSPGEKPAPNSVTPLPPIPLSPQAQPGTGSAASEAPVPLTPAPETIESPAPIEKMGTGSEASESPAPILSSDDPFAGQSELTADCLIYEVQARNPSLAAMIAAWQAAAQLYPQMISLDDPMFSYMLGTKGLGPDGGYMFMGSQKIPWFGKRQLRGSAAQAQSDAAGQDVADLRLRLAESAADALFDLYLVRRETEINAANVELMRDFRAIALARYESAQVTQQDVLQADLELADLEARAAELARQQAVAIARINTLLHRPADCPLPPPANLSPPCNLPPVEALRDMALARRPDLAAQSARIRAEEANVDLACKQYYPDLEIVGKYDAFMPEEMRPQLGMNLNVPLWQHKRSAAWREATAKLEQERAQYANLADQARFEVQSAYAELVESDRLLRLYDEKILPVANLYVKSARANYTAGKTDFLRLVDAQRQLYGQWEKFYQAQTDYHRRLAEMCRAVGGAF
ncbi:MAG: TolC family protein [Thermoguttaceae bacterium]